MCVQGPACSLILLKMDYFAQHRKLMNLQHILVVFGHFPPNSIRKCKKLIRKRIFVNLYDIQEGFCRPFPDLNCLHEYTTMYNLFYPKWLAKKNGWNCLLRTFV
jgi:hypothetical protein